VGFDIIRSDENIVTPKENSKKMKKLMTAMLGLSLLTGFATVSFARPDDTTKTEEKKKKAKKTKKEKAKKGEDTNKMEEKK